MRAVAPDLRYSKACVFKSNTAWFVTAGEPVVPVGLSRLPSP